ncbi:hypothetical protein SAMN05216311_103115 [Chitinophaga sp. CF418]|nr:hypothetical protein SAMN05216311_103115 [Chitinophaga sp. CF418]
MGYLKLLKFEDSKHGKKDQAGREEASLKGPFILPSVIDDAFGNFPLATNSCVDQITNPPYERGSLSQCQVAKCFRFLKSLFYLLLN